MTTRNPMTYYAIVRQDGSKTIGCYDNFGSREAMQVNETLLAALETGSLVLKTYNHAFFSAFIADWNLSVTI